ncbi:hypothetical protein ACFE04_006846 [Oxalis oulophora]
MVSPQAAAAAAPNSQQTLQFLSSVLSQRGPSSLPYTEDTKWLIRQHLLSLTQTYPSLEPKTATFTHNDGRCVNLLQADGTIPMPFHGVTYNIPVIIWLMESYPRHAPCVYLNPTRDMIIKRPHNHVTPSGLVTVDYLLNWVYPSSNLIDLVRSLGSAFANDPPLYSQRRTNPNANTNTNPNPSQVTAHQHHVYPRPQQGGIPSPRPFPPSPYGGAARIQQQQQQQSHTDDASEVYKRNAVNKILETVHGDLTSMRKSREAEMEGMFNAQAVLRRREEEINGGLKELQDEKEGLEQQLQIVMMNTDVIDGWVRSNEGKVKNFNGGDLDIDAAYDCVDSLSKQMLDSSAADLAIEDVVYALDKAVQEGAVPFDLYLRNVRLLSREQFFHRATAAKVKAAQMHAQVTAMAARAQPRYAT